MPVNDPVQYYNRDSGKIENETIYGEGYLKFIYGNPLGKIALWAAVRRAWFSIWYGRRMRSPRSVIKIVPFIESYGLDPEEFVVSVGDFENFDAFFARKIRPEKRPIDSFSDSVVFPADGRHLAIADLATCNGLWTKGQKFDLEKLLGNREQAERYEGGSALVSRLCPTDYHRFHFPCDGNASSPNLINGFLYSVSPIALRRKVSYLWENRRVLTDLDSQRLGRVALLEIGATCVGSIKQTYQIGEVQKGSEKGYFHFGGSMIMIFFERGKVVFSEDLLENGALGREVYGRMGDRCGEACV